MTTIVTRQTTAPNANNQNSTLSIAQLDSNIVNLNTGKLDQTGYRGNVYPSLNLDFTKGKLDPRINFNRASTGTYYDGKTVALAEQNLILYSNFVGGQVIGSIWSTFAGSTVSSNNVMAPDGTLTGTNIAFTSGQISGTYQSLAIPIGYVYTLSVYAKSTVGKKFKFRYYGSPQAASSDITTTSTWTRYSFTFTSNLVACAVGMENDSGTSAGSVQFWGAQLETRSTMGPYTQTVAQTITNYIPQLIIAPANVPRFSYDPLSRKPLGLLIEQQSTNLLTYSGDLTNAAWSKNSSPIVSSNYTVAMDGSFTAQRFQSSTYYSGVYQLITFVPGTTYTATWYVKDNGGYNKFMQFGVGTQAFSSGSGDRLFNLNLTTGAVSGINAVFTIPPIVTSLGNGIWKVSLTYTATGFGSVAPNIMYGNGIGVDAIFYGAQQELGSTATSYIPTTSSTVTRAADSVIVNGTNFSNFYNQSEGTIFVERSLIAANTNQTVFSIDNGTTVMRSRNAIISNVKNLLTYSADFTKSVWVGANCNATQTAVLAPDGSSYAQHLTETSATGYHTLTQSFTDNSISTFSIYAKQAERKALLISNVPNGNCIFDLNAGVVNQLGSNWTLPTITPVGNGWYRCTITSPTQSWGNVIIGVTIGNNGNYTGDGVSGIYVWGAQVELGSTATSYEPNPRYTPFEIGNSFIQTSTPTSLNEKDAFSYTANTLYASINNSLPDFNSNTNYAITNMTELVIGDSAVNPGRTLNGTIKYFRYYPKASNSSTLFALTAPSYSYFNTENGFDFLLMEDGSSRLTAEWST